MTFSLDTRGRAWLYRAVEKKVAIQLAASGRSKNVPDWRLRVFVFTVIGLLAAGQGAASDAVPTIAKDSIQVTAFTFSSYRKNVDIWSWAPVVRFRVSGSSASGSQLYAEFHVPSAPPVKFDCKTEHVQTGSWAMGCGGRDVPEEKGSTYTGSVNFAIGIRNELSGSDTTLFNGRVKVAKVHSNEHGPKFGNHFDYYVEQDWNLPVGYVYLTPAPVVGWKRPQFNVAFWVRGDSSGLQPHLFYQGNEVGKMFLGNSETGRAVCSADIENGTTHSLDDSSPQKARWSRVVCLFPNVLGWDQSGKHITAFPGETGSRHMLSGNPGDYEVKVLWKSHLARSIKFAVDAKGQFDNGIATQNHLGSDRVIVPVQIIGDQDGTWDRAAWKTEAFFGNPLAGFSPAQ